MPKKPAPTEPPIAGTALEATKSQRQAPPAGWRRYQAGPWVTAVSTSRGTYLVVEGTIDLPDDDPSLSQLLDHSIFKLEE
jgi:hypothetical protein